MFGIGRLRKHGWAIARQDVVLSSSGFDGLSHARQNRHANSRKMPPLKRTSVSSPPLLHANINLDCPATYLEGMTSTAADASRLKPNIR